MRVDEIALGTSPPDDVNIVVTTPVGTDPMRVEVDPQSGLLTVTRLFHTAMRNPGTTGILPRTATETGGPLSAFLPVGHVLMPGMVVAARPVGVLYIAGAEADEVTVLAVPASRVTGRFDRVRNYTDFPPAQLRQLSHYLSHAQDLEDDQDVRSAGWGDVDEARRVILEAARRVGSADLVG